MIGQDVTERDRRREQTQLEARLTSIGRLAAGVAHEANNPLAYTMSNLGFARELVSADEPPSSSELQELREALAEAYEGADRVRIIVRDLQSFARADAHAMAEMDLSALVSRSISMCRQNIGSRARLEQLSEAGVTIVGNQARLAQVIINLLTNAAQAMPEGRAVASNVVSVDLRRTQGRGAVLEIQDNGVGMTDAVLARIFEPFFTTKPVGKGTGLGLSISHSILKEHGAELNVRSRPGEGTVFRVTFPELPAAGPNARSRAD